MYSSKSITAHFVHPPISVTLDKVGVYGCGESWLRGPTGEQYLYVIVTDGETTLDLRVPAAGHFELADNEVVSVNRKIFSTTEVDDYLRFFVTAWEADGEGFEQLIYDAIALAATIAVEAETGGTGLAFIFTDLLSELIGSLVGAEDDALGNYEHIWFSTDSWGVGSHQVAADDLRLWFTISEG